MSIKDLHICNTPMTSKSETGSCIYGAEYSSQDLLPEDYSTTSSISWQHFPKSTSARSHSCDDSDETVVKSVSEPTPTPTVKEESLKESSTEYPITKSFAQLNALHYLEVRHVFEFLNFLMSHLVCNEPDNPIEFLVDLLTKCLRYRDSFGEPPLLFTSSHIKMVYAAFDPFGRGHITGKQYHEAMRSLGLDNSITPYNKEPMNQEDSCVDETYFLLEAERCLEENLRKMLRIPKIWEENRKVWKKRMKQKSEREMKSFKSENSFMCKTECRGCQADTDQSSTIPSICYMKCMEDGKDNCHVEQLYLD